MVEENGMSPDDGEQKSILVFLRFRLATSRATSGSGPLKGVFSALKSVK